MLGAAVILFRVHQMPDDPPGFDVGQFEEQVQAHLAEGMATADVLRRAIDLISTPPGGLEDRSNSAALAEQDRGWLQNNSRCLKLLLDASGRPYCYFGDPATETQLTFIDKKLELTQLMLVSARQLEEEGDLDAALDRCFATLRMTSHLAAADGSIQPYGEVAEPRLFHDVFNHLAHWMARRGQTSERIRGAIERLESVDSRILRLDEKLKTDYVLAQTHRNERHFGAMVHHWLSQRRKRRSIELARHPVASAHAMGETAGIALHEFNDARLIAAIGGNAHDSRSWAEAARFAQGSFTVLP